MMLDDEMPDHAVPVLTSLLKDLEHDGTASAFTSIYWELQSRCCNDLCAYNET